MNDYLTAKIKTQISEQTRDRNVIELGSAIRVFEKAWSWMKMLFGVAASLLLVTGVTLFWRTSDFNATVTKAQQNVTSTAQTSTEQINQDASKTKSDMATALNQGKAVIAQTSAVATKQVTAFKAEVSAQSAAFKRDLETSRQQLQAATSLQPQMTSIQTQLTQALGELREQQKTISSSQDFVKDVFSSHATEFFVLGQSPANRYLAVPPPPGGNKTVVFILLKQVPITNTLQLQYRIFSQPPNSYFNIKNLVVFFWGDPPDNLKTQEMIVSYFPDSSDKNIISSLSQHDGHVFADDQPLPDYQNSIPAQPASH